MFYFTCTRINSYVNNREAGDLRRHRAHYDVTVMELAQRPVTRSFDVFFYLHPNKQLSKQS